MRRTFGRSGLGLGCLAAAALTLGVAVSAADKAVETTAADKAVEAKDAGKSAPVKDAPQGNETLSQKDVMLLTPKSGQDAGKAFLNAQNKGQMPWQFYKQYADVFYALKERSLDAQTKGKDQAERVGVQAAYYEKLGKLIEEMAEQKHIIDDIKIQNTEIPVAQRADALTKAENQHGEIMREFVAEFKSPPQAAARTKAEK